MSDKPRRTGRFAVTLAVACLGLAGCSPGTDQERASTASFPTAATLGEQELLSVSDYLAREPYASADRKTGERLLMQCRACHAIKDGSSHRLGPDLYGLFGRQAGSLDDYGYTAALREADFVWTPRALNAWLAMPSRFLPGNAMAFGGIFKEGDRDALIASLLLQSSGDAR